MRGQNNLTIILVLLWKIEKNTYFCKKYIFEETI